MQNSRKCCFCVMGPMLLKNLLFVWLQQSSALQQLPCRASLSLSCPAPFPYSLPLLTSVPVPDSLLLLSSPTLFSYSLPVLTFPYFPYSMFYPLCLPCPRLMKRTGTLLSLSLRLTTCCPGYSRQQREMYVGRYHVICSCSEFRAGIF